MPHDMRLPPPRPRPSHRRVRQWASWLPHALILKPRSEPPSSRRARPAARRPRTNAVAFDHERRAALDEARELGVARLVVGELVQLGQRVVSNDDEPPPVAREAAPPWDAIELVHREQ